VTAQDDERRRIERDIHDGVQQSVVALITKLALVRSQLGRGAVPADDALGELQGDARELLNDLRELAHGIHPPVLSDRGLVAAVEARAGRLPVPVSIRASAVLRERRYGTDTEGAAYYLICEALTNVVKHAAATDTVVDFSAGNGCLHVTVTDNGTGFSGTPHDGAHDGGTSGRGTGLTNLRDRVEALGGTLQVQTAPGQGTRIRAQLPITTGSSNV
jgi:signal transduction histidine kinase